MHNIVSNIGAAAARILIPAVISFLSYFSISVEAEAGTPSSHPVKTGIEVLRDRGFEGLVGKRVGLVTNPSGVDRDLRSTIDILYNAPGVELVALYGPEHGVRGDVYAGGKVSDSRDALTGLPLEQTITIGQLTAASTKENALVNGDEYPDSYLLGYYYIFAADQSTSYSMDVTCYDQNNNGIGTRNLSSIPLQKNKLTTVIGNFYTSESSLEIIVEDPFEDAVYEVKADATE